MARLLIFIVIGAIALLLSLAKSAAGKVTGNEALKSSTLKGEAAKVMDTTARGLDWMDKQWQESKAKAQDLDQSPPRD